MRAVVFDLGGVLVDWDPRYLLRKVMPGRVEEMEAILRDVLNHEWNLARDAGDSWPAAMSELEAAHPQWADIFRAYDERWDETLGGSHDDSVQILRELKELGVPLYALSNWSAQKFPHAEERFEWLQCFDGIVVSGRVKLVKPEPAIFRHLLATFGLVASETVFIDDHGPNVIAAREAGIDAIHFQGAEALRHELEERGILSA